MRTIRRSLAVIGLLAVLIPFQNCSSGSSNKPEGKTNSSSTGNGGFSDPCYGQFCATYYDEIDQSGTSLNAYEQVPVDYDWGDSSPDPQFIDPDTFSAYYYGIFEFNAGQVQFDVTSDDGIRVAVDGQVIIDEYYDQAPTQHAAIVNLTAGRHTVEVWYYENGGGAALRVNWQQL